MVIPSLTRYLGFNGVGRKHKSMTEWQDYAQSLKTNGTRMKEEQESCIKYPIELAEMQELAKWVREAVRTHMANGNVLDEMDAYHLSIKPSSDAS